MTALKAVTASTGARRRMAAVAALAAGAALALAGCSAGQISQTADQASAINGNNVDLDKIALRNVHIVYPVGGGEYSNAQGGKALIAMSIVNTSETVPEELTSISTDLGSVRIIPATGDKVEIGPQETVVAGTTALAGHGGDGHSGDGHSTAEPDGHGAAPSTSATAAPSTTAAPETTMAPSDGGTDQPVADPNANPATIEITGLTKDITPGLTYNVTFNFKQNGTVTVSVPVDAASAERHEDEMSGPAAPGAGGH